jgi:hypothetical protein
MAMDIDDETLMALVDGEITGDKAARLQTRIAADPELARRYALFTETAERVKAAAIADPDAKVSPALTARIRDIGRSTSHKPGNVVPLRRAAPRWQPVALAASLALAVGLSAGLLLSPRPPAPDGPALTADLRDRLDTLLSGDKEVLVDGRNLSVIASFTDGSGAFCREYEIGTHGATVYVSVACRDDADWSLRFATTKPEQSGDYAPAASLEALDAFYATTGASQPLSPEEERRFLILN